MAAVSPIDPNDLLRQLLVGASITGIRFGALQVLLSSPKEAGECFINLSSAFHVFGSRPTAFPVSEADVPEMSEEDELLCLFELRFEDIRQAEIVDPQGHLAITFSNGSILYVNGNNSGPEPWDVGLNAADRSKSVRILAISGGHPIVFNPFADER